MRRWAREAVVMRGGDWRARAYARREAGDSGRAFARRASRSRGEGEVGGRVQEGEPGVRGAAGGEEGVIHGDVPVGCLGPGLCRDLGEPFLAGREGGPWVGEDAVERFQGRGGQPEDRASGGSDGGGGEDCSARDEAAGGRCLPEGKGLGGEVLRGEGKGEPGQGP